MGKLVISNLNIISYNILAVWKSVDKAVNRIDSGHKLRPGVFIAVLLVQGLRITTLRESLCLE